MPEHTPYQRKVIERYYDNRDDIMLAKLEEITSDLYLADTDAKKSRLWKRAQQAMEALKIPQGILDHILTKRDPAILARNLRGWLKRGNQTPPSRR